jgi:chemotaxis protein MotB
MNSVWTSVCVTAKRGARVACLMATVATVGLGLTGCIGQSEYDRLAELNRSLTARNAELQRERDECRSSLDLMRGNIGSSAGTLEDLRRQNADLRAQLDKALADYRSMGDRLSGMQFGPLDAATDEAIQRLVAQYPGLMTYDPLRGMIRFNADLTFDSGSDVVRPQAKEALAKLAEILNSPSASVYDVIVEGHTDSQRISRAETVREHRTNRRLSTNRANSVINEIGNMGVHQQRLMAAGWGEYRPSVPNAPGGNTPQNRRVEIYLAKWQGAGAPMGDTGGADMGGNQAQPVRDVPPTRAPEMNK